MSSVHTDANTATIIEALAAGVPPSTITETVHMRLADLAAIVASPAVAAALENLRQLQILHESITLAKARARAMRVLMQLIGDDSLPANPVEARARETRRKACADILRCKAPDQSNTAAPGRTKGDAPDHTKGGAPSRMKGGADDYTKGGAPAHANGSVPDRAKGNVPVHANGGAPDRSKAGAPAHTKSH
jgi:hypothetical protein